MLVVLICLSCTMAIMLIGMAWWWWMDRASERQRDQVPVGRENGLSEGSVRHEQVAQITERGAVGHVDAGEQQRRTTLDVQYM